MKRKLSGKTNKRIAREFLIMVGGAACAVVVAAPAALAQVPSSAPVELPPITVVAPKKKSVAEPVVVAKPDKAPASAQQASVPRARKVKPSAAAPVEAPPAFVAEEPAAAASVVSPTGIATSVDETGASVTVVTAAQIDATQRRTANDVLQSVPGINVVNYGAPGRQTSVFTRGTNSNHTKVLIDGIDVSDPSTSNRSFDFGQLTAFDIGRIEVLRGPQSGLYGADALGGAVVVYTKDGEKGSPVIEGLVEAGSFGTFNQAVSARGGVDNFRYAINGSHFFADGTQTMPREIVPPGGVRLDDKYENWSTSAKFGIDVTRDVTINLVGRYMTSNLAYQAYPSDTVRSTQEYDQLSGRAEAVVRSFGGRMTTFVGASRSNSQREYTFSGYPGDPYEGDRVKYDWRSVIGIVPGTELTVGADWQDEKLSTTGLSASEHNTGGFAQLQTEPIRNLFLAGNVRFDDNEQFGGHTTWRFSPVYVIEETGTKLKANVGTAFKAPTLDQRYHDYPGVPGLYGPFFGNPNLKPEESTGVDAGFEQEIFGGRAQFGAVYFYNDIKNLIQSGTIPGSCVGFICDSTYYNIGKARTSGVEAFASADITKDLRVRLDYTYTEAVDEDTDQDLLRRPKNKATLSVGWRPMPPLLLTGSINYVGETADIDRITYGRVTLPSYTFVNVAAEYEINEHITAFGRIDNLFDKHYQNPAGWENPGIGAYAGIKLRN